MKVEKPPCRRGCRQPLRAQPLEMAPWKLEDVSLLHSLSAGDGETTSVFRNKPLGDVRKQITGVYVAEWCGADTQRQMECAGRGAKTSDEKLWVKCPGICYTPGHPEVRENFKKCRLEAARKKKQITSSSFWDPEKMPFRESRGSKEEKYRSSGRHREPEQEMFSPFGIAGGLFKNAVRKRRKGRRETWSWESLESSSRSTKMPRNIPEEEKLPRQHKYPGRAKKKIPRDVHHNFALPCKTCSFFCQGCLSKTSQEPNPRNPNTRSRTKNRWATCRHISTGQPRNNASTRTRSRQLCDEM